MPRDNGKNLNAHVCVYVVGEVNQGQVIWLLYTLRQSAFYCVLLCKAQLAGSTTYLKSDET